MPFSFLVKHQTQTFLDEVTQWLPLSLSVWRWCAGTVLISAKASVVRLRGISACSLSIDQTMAQGEGFYQANMVLEQTLSCGGVRLVEAPGQGCWLRWERIAVTPAARRAVTAKAARIVLVCNKLF